MNAWVKTTNGKFPNPNFYSAWLGFQKLNYNVMEFDVSDFSDPTFWISCNRSTPVFAGVKVFDEILDKMGVVYNKIDTYPDQLNQFLHRDIQLTTLGEFRTAWNKSETDIPKLFMKPVEQKLFTGRVMNTLLDWCQLVNLPPESPVYIAEPVKFVSEFRIYISKGKIIMGKHYQGDWTRMVDTDVVKQAIEAFGSSAPCAYALDFGLLDNGTTALVEYNDATSLGNYGMSPILHAGMLVDRWHELTQ
jgi:hypothetical protein